MTLTDKQIKFVEYIVYNGVSGSEAARRADYSPMSARQTASQLLANKNIQQAIRTEQFKLLGGTLASKALRTLEKIMDDESAPFGARVDACKTILDRAGVVTSKSILTELNIKPVQEMDRAELEQFIRDADSFMKANEAIKLNEEVS